MLTHKVVVSGAPGTGKTTVASLLAAHLGIPLLSLDVIKEALADGLGLGDEAWSNQLGDAAAEVLFRLAAEFPAVVTEGWWRRDRRERAVTEFAAWNEVFCTCPPAVAEARVRERASAGRHPIHRDVINPHLLSAAAEDAAKTIPLGCGSRLVRVDTSEPVDPGQLATSLGLTAPVLGGDPT